MNHQEPSRELTRAELQIMQILWDKGPSFVIDIIEHMEEPKPAYNTVSTIVRILEKKGFAGYQVCGKSHRYYPLLSREDYTSGYMKNVLHNFFGNSVSHMVSFFAEKEKISLLEMDKIMTILKESAEKNKDRKS